VAVGVAFVVVMGLSGVPVGESILFLASQILLCVVPGTLVWRRLRGDVGPLVEDAALGTAVGHTINLFAYLAFRSLDLPVFTVAVPIAVVVLFLLVPAWRGDWRGFAGHSMLPPARHAVAGFVGAYLMVWALVVQGFNPVGSGAERGQGTDYPYLLGLAAELTHHAPPAFPFVDGEALHYHWFVFADIAATHWRTGIELDLLTFRLVPTWLLLVTVLAFGAVARRITRDVRTAFLAVGIAVFAGAAILPGWGTFSELDVASGSLLNRFNWAESPTQGFALLLSMPLTLLLVECVRRDDERLGWGKCLLIGGLALGLLGAKASFLPVLGAGLIGVLAHRAFQRRFDRRAFGLGSVLLVILLAGQVWLFGGESQGLSVNPVATLERLANSLGLGVDTGPAAMGAAAVMLAILWLAPHLGAFWKLDDPDPAVWFLLGAASVSAVVSVLFTHPGLSQMFFVRAGLPWAALLAAWGLSSRLPRDWSPVRAGLLMGALVDVVLLAVTADSPRESGDSWVALWTVAHAAGLAACLVGAHVLARPRRSAVGVPVLACVIVLGFSAGGTLTDWLSPPVQADFGAAGPVPAGGIEAARYIRAHSSPHDRVATNAHCALPDTEVCDTRHHWMAAWTERRFVVEGWGYSAQANRGASDMADAVTTDFWDQDLLALNDDLFTHPGRETLQALTEAHRVGWLLVDARFPADVEGLERLLPEHRRFGDAIVFRVG
jgi:hypothetical protein